MNRRRIGGGPLAARLAVLVLLPLVPLAVLTVDRVDEANVRIRSADDVVEVLELQRAVAATRVPAAMERTSLIGYARLESFGIPREAITTVSEVDILGLFDANEALLDRALDDVAAELGAVGPNAPDVARAFAAVRGAITEQRALDDSRHSNAADLDTAYRHLDEFLTAVMDQAWRHAERHDGAPSAATSRLQLSQLDNVVHVSTDYSENVMMSLLDRSPQQAAEMVASRAAYERSIAAFSTALGPAQAEKFGPVLESMPVLPQAIYEGKPGAEITDLDPELIAIAGTVMSEGLGHVGELDDYLAGFHGEVITEVRDHAAQARDDRQRTVLLVSVAAVLSPLLLGLAARSMLVPLRRLTRRATAISAGHLHLDPLPVNGPRDTRILTMSVNDMLTSLDVLDRQTKALASGELDSPALAEELPGDLGRSLRESVARLASVTAELQRSEMRASAIVEQAADGIWTLDADGRILSANRAAEALVGIPADAQVGQPLVRFLGTFSGEQTLRRPDGDAPLVLAAHTVIPAHPAPLLTVFARDISERQQFEERLAHLARHDMLTGLSNRYAALEQLDQLLADADTNCVVMFVDVDSFKSVNDTHGHGAGDQVLVEIGDRLRRAAGPGDVVARIGGDEFLVVHTSWHDDTAAIAFGHRLIRVIEEPHRIGEHVFSVSASIGLAFPPPNSSPIQAIQMADAAAYQAKRRGRRRVEIYDADLQASIEHQAELELLLRNAIAADELVVHYQPIFDLRTRTCTGAEALVRWNRPGIGMVPPNDFIPVAERSSLIIELERWVLRRVCEQLAEWRRRDPATTMRIAINISGRHLIDGDLLDDLDAALSATGADPTMLEVELTETHLVDDLDVASGILDAMRARGIRIAVDDFGTGYSSMTYLRQLPVDAIKIDRSFVARAGENGYDSTVIEALLTIGRTLRLEVIAEGVETEDQLAYLAVRGCQKGQGYLLARPAPIETLDAIFFETPPALRVG